MGYLTFYHYKDCHLFRYHLNGCHYNFTMQRRQQIQKYHNCTRGTPTPQARWDPSQHGVANDRGCSCPLLANPARPRSLASPGPFTSSSSPRSRRSPPPPPPQPSSPSCLHGLKVCVDRHSRHPTRFIALVLIVG